MLKIIIIDFDGVIVESVNIKTEAFRELFKEYKDLVDDIVQYHLQNNAISRFIKFKYIYEHFLGKEYNKEIEKEVGKKFSEIVFRKVVECPFVVGAEKFLKIFSKMYPIYLISATPPEELERIVAKRNIEGYFKEVWGSSPGNKVDFIKRAIENENVKAEEVVYIGDMVEDFKIAQKTGVLFVGRKNVESFAGFSIPVFPDLVGIKEWVQNKIGDKAL